MLFAALICGCIGGRHGINYESLASLDPDVVFLRKGASSFRGSDENLEKTIKTIESLGIPLVVLVGPPYQERPDVDRIGEWTLDFYQQVYEVDEVASKELRSVQWLDWTVEEGL
ncbi:hypothetical protein RJ40_12120 [Methanofollis aquaemaris]|uniref:Fe/B12 periplasmic-binding domain-containing protein n=1 Tax=Methanofollis aquaemaris TaxID=126734 RepID=A0A8A3S7D2_9EURY|nr:hypothetical protein [Methanofollis aquaemaris]QSZ68187.1 hypothetical protein RJ40_12120 [Methanofollis aquaemaris]